MADTLAVHVRHARCDIGQQADQGRPAVDECGRRKRAAGQGVAQAPAVAIFLRAPNSDSFL
jgi:hypothetical protein